MIILYKFESSDVIRKYKYDGKTIDMDTLMVNILKDIFGTKPASCYLQPLNMEEGVLYEEGMDKVVLLKRTYKQKFAVKIPTPQAADSPKRKRVVIRKRRWKSPKSNWGKRNRWSRPFKRRWVENGK